MSAHYYHISHPLKRLLAPSGTYMYVLTFLPTFRIMSPSPPPGVFLPSFSTYNSITDLDSFPLHCSLLSLLVHMFAPTFLGTFSPTAKFCPLPVLMFRAIVWDPTPQSSFFAPSNNCWSSNPLFGSCNPRVAFDLQHLLSNPLFWILLPHVGFCPLPVLKFWPTVWDPASPMVFFAPFL